MTNNETTKCERCGNLYMQDEFKGHRCIVRLTSSSVATPQRDSRDCPHYVGCEHDI